MRTMLKLRYLAAFPYARRVRPDFPALVLLAALALLGCGARTGTGDLPAGIDGGVRGPDELFLLAFATGAIRLGIVAREGGQYTVLQLSYTRFPDPPGLRLSEGWGLERAFRTNDLGGIASLGGETGEDAVSVTGRIEVGFECAPDVDVVVTFAGGDRTRIVGRDVSTPGRACP